MLDKRLKKIDLNIIYLNEHKINIIKYINKMSSSKTNFEKIVDFNTQFGVMASSELIPKPNIIKEDPKTVEFCLKLIREEMKELEEAVVNDDFVEVIDALGDILYVVGGMSARLGVNLDKAFDLIHQNNMEKLCKTEADAIASVEYYKTNTQLGYDSPAYRLSPDSMYYVVYNQSTNKILKSISWAPVDLSGVCK